MNISRILHASRNTKDVITEAGRCWSRKGQEWRSAGVSRAGRAYGEENVPRNAPRGRNEDDQSEEVAAQEGKGRRERRQGEAEADACNSQRKRSSCTLLPPNYVSSLAL